MERRETDMKLPKGPDWLNGSPPPREEEEEERRTAGGRRAKRERRQSSSSATVCQVCSIRLNSRTQAQIHYRGKTHQRRLRRLARAVGSGALSQSQVHPLLGSLPLPGGPLQPQTCAQLGHFLPLRMDPVQKAVINHTFSVSLPKKMPIISCNICHLRFNSTTQAEAHYKGHKHARKMKALETQSSRQKNRRDPSTAGRGGQWDKGGAAAPDSHLKEITGTSSSSATPEGAQRCSSQPSSSDSSSPVPPQPSPQIPPDPQSDPPADGPPLEGGRLVTSSAPQADPQGSLAAGEEEEEASRNLHCVTCKVTVNSSSQLETHCSGSKHKQMLDGHSSSHSQTKVKMTSSPRPACRVKQRMRSKTRAVVGVSSQPFHCDMCQVSVNSETQLKQHMNSRRHKERLVGRSAKVKFTPYSKLQPSAILATKLALQKQLSEVLPPGFLTSPLGPAALCAMASGPMALRLPPRPTAVLQGPLISPTLFRPAPGPLRATHTPIVFSPY